VFYLCTLIVKDGEPITYTEIGIRNGEYEANTTFAMMQIVSNKLGFRRVFFTDIRVITTTSSNFGELLNQSMAIGTVILTESGNYYIPNGTYTMNYSIFFAESDITIHGGN